VSFRVSLDSSFARASSRSSGACPLKPWRSCGRKDTSTLHYDTYFNDDQSECMVLERFRDSDALIEHARTVATYCAGASHRAVRPGCRARSARRRADDGRGELDRDHEGKCDLTPTNALDRGQRLSNVDLNGRAWGQA
jgi:hypothetical protein